MVLKVLNHKRHQYRQQNLDSFWQINRLLRNSFEFIFADEALIIMFGNISNDPLGLQVLKFYGC